MSLQLEYEVKTAASMKLTFAHFFKAGSYVLILIAVLHLAGQFWLSRPVNDTERELVRMMTSYEKKIAGGKLSMMEIQDGLGLCYALFFLFIGCLNLFLANVIHDQSVIRQVSFINALAFAVGTVISVLYFFWIPVASFAVAMTCFALAGFAVRSS